MFRGSDIPRVLIIGGFLLLGACSTDAPTTPSTLTAPAATNADVIVESSVTDGDSIVVHLRVTPTGGWYAIGKSGVYFPPNSICEPTQSTYGPTEWDKPCTPAKRDIHVRARTSADGTSSWINFSPDLRFVPSDDPKQWVYIYMHSADVKGAKPSQRDSIAKKFTIFWVPTGSTVRIDESLTDPTLVTRFHWKAGWVYRRIEHFSGYQVGVGYVNVEVKSDDLLGTESGTSIGY